MPLNSNPRLENKYVVCINNKLINQLGKNSQVLVEWKTKLSNSKASYKISKKPQKLSLDDGKDAEEIYKERHSN